MAMTPEQFDLYMKNKHQELTEAWQAFPPTEIEIMTKAIMDYQYKATTAIIKMIDNMNAINYDRWSQIMAKLEKIENDLKQQKED